MVFSPLLKKVIHDLKTRREKLNITPEMLEEELGLNGGWIEAFENCKIFPSTDLFLLIAYKVGFNVNEAFQGHKVDLQNDLSRMLIAAQNGPDLSIIFDYNGREAKFTIHKATTEQFADIRTFFIDSLSTNGLKETVRMTFFKALEKWPHANPSDLWYFLMSRIYQDKYNLPLYLIGKDLSQSWKRTSGWALEEIFIQNYQASLKKQGILIKRILGDESKKYIQKMKLSYPTKEIKADLFLINELNKADDCFGILHIKASLAERRSSDQGLSKALMEKQYFSPFITMDCKSTPSANPVNKGEFGEPYSSGDDVRSDKRKEIEEDGIFTSVFSYNKNTKPTPKKQKATSRIFTLGFGNSNDEFVKQVVASRDRLYGK